MALEKQSSHLVIGLPDTGKTTFIVALWYVAESAEIPTVLTVQRLHGNSEHLNSLREDWLRCKPVSRTELSSETIVSMLLADSRTKDAGEVFFPDMSGESFNLQWKDRKCTKRYFDLANSASGVLLFVHPHETHEPTAIEEVADIVEEVTTGSPEQSRPDEANPWNPDCAPTQVELVDLLQFLVRPPIAQDHLRVAIVISAWDLISKNGNTPEKWLATRLPLLHQYLVSNPERFEVMVYGVSAQGGDLERDADRLLAESSPSRRVLVVAPDGQTNDLTVLIKWLMG